MAPSNRTGDVWAKYFVASLALQDPPASESKNSTVLYIIIGVITAVALVITVVLIVSLNRKRENEYMPVDDLEDDRLLTDTY